jgi:LemA protein
MKKISTGLVILGVIVLIGFWLASGYNGLVTAQESVDGSWSQVETQYQRRIDLIPNLVSTVKGAADFEQETFTQVTAARSQWQNAGSRGEQIAAAGNFDGALGRLLVTVESYPQLQATQSFRDFMVQLEGTENRISTARRDFNETVRSFNVRVKRFPTNLLASMFGFDAEKFFEAAEGSDQAPNVEF